MRRETNRLERDVLAVAGAVRIHPRVLAIGLLISVVPMGVAANLITRLLRRHRLVAWIGLAAILFVALEMIGSGYDQVADVAPALPRPYPGPTPAVPRPG